MTKKIIYFLCTGNSCRSQRAEGFAKKYLSDRYVVYSAGMEAHGINPLAVKVMKEVGIDISSQTSDVIDKELFQNAHMIITLCDDAKESCPTIPSHVKHVHWGFDDPAKAVGTEAEKWEVFQRVRDEIEERMKKLSTLLDEYY